MLCIYDVGGKLLNGTESMNVNSLAYLRVKWGEVSVSGWTVE